MTKGVTKTVKGKIGSGLSKLSKGADWLGAIGGYAGTVGSAASSWGSPFLEGAVDMHMNAVSRHNFMAVLDTPNRLSDPNWNPFLITGAVMAVGGWVAKVVPNIVPHQSTIGSIVSKAGVGMAIGSGLAIMVSELAQGSSPFDKQGTKSGGSRQGSASTSGRVPFPGMVKNQAKYPSDGRKTWSAPRD